MKLNYLILILFLCSFSSEATRPKINGTEQNWSGGVCCRKGTNYSLNFKIKNQKADQIIIQKVCLNNVSFTDLTINKTSDSKFTYFILSFNFITNASTDPSFQAEQSVSTPIYENCPDRAIFYQFKGKNHFWKIKKIISLPSFAYP